MDRSENLNIYQPFLTKKLTSKKYLNAYTETEEEYPIFEFLEMSEYMMRLSNL